MTEQGKLRSIGCTQCGAPLELLGGHKVRSITCGYCGAVLDTREEYRVVSQYRDLHRPDTPLKIGMRGSIKGVEFTIIGMVQWVATDGGWPWLELLVFSPTHGYAWLEHDRGHFVFTRRIRDVPHIPLAQKASFNSGGHEFRVFEHYDARIVFVEGELTWVAEVGDQVSITEAIAPPMIFAREQVAGEEEYLIGEYLEPGDLYAAFGVEGAPGKPQGIHPAQPFRPSPLLQGLSRAAMVFLPLAILLVIVLELAGGGTVLTSGTVRPAQFAEGAESEPFRVEDPGTLLALDLHSALSNAWGWFEIEVSVDDEPLLAMAKEISYYHGVEGGESWSEGSRSARAYFKVPEAGEYTLAFSGEGGRGNKTEGPPRQALSYELKEGVIATRYFMALSVLFALALAGTHLRRMIFESSRWSDVLEDDDDD